MILISLPQHSKSSHALMTRCLVMIFASSIITSSPLLVSDSAQASAQSPDAPSLPIKPRPLPGIEPAVKEAIERRAKANRRSEVLRQLSASPLPGAPCPSSSLKARLKGVFIGDRQYRSYAQVRTNRADHIYRLGDQLEDRVLIGIQWGDAGPRVVLEVNDRYECLELRVGDQHILSRAEGPKVKPEPAPQRSQPQEKMTTHAQRSDRDMTQYEVKELGPHLYAVSRATLTQLSQPEQITRLARIIPHYREGKSVGFKIVGIRRDSILSQIGFKTGDVLRSINGAEINSLEATQSIWAQDPLRTFDHFTFDVLRRGAPISLNIVVK